MVSVSTSLPSTVWFRSAGIPNRAACLRLVDCSPRFPPSRSTPSTPRMKLRVLLWVGVALVAAVSASTDADRALSSLDSDNDGVPNARDACPHTTRAVHVDAIGCSEMQVDNDYDHVCDRSRPKVKSTGDYARTKWCTGLDNCKYVRNPGQRDHDNDGHGDACDTGTFAVMGAGFWRGG